jgi:pimeloyl-ACP methyl ester carboxylesterase
MQTSDIPDSTYTTSWSGGRGAVRFFVRSGGSRLRYYTAGTGPPLVLLHTVRTQLDYFQRVIPRLWDDYTVYALDFPGMGWSDIVSGASYEQPDLRAAVVKFVTGLDLREVTLAGESLGAAVALLAAIDLYERILRVIAFNPYDYPGGLERGNALARFIGTSIRWPGSGPLFARMESRPILTGVLRGGFANPDHLPAAFVTELRRSGRRRGYARVARAVMRNLPGFIDARAQYSRITVPVTVVYSEHDWSRPTERHEVLRLLADVDTITLPDAGHFSALERPDDVSRILRRSIERIPRR